MSDTAEYPPLGTRLKVLRKSRGWTQKDLADMAGGNHANVSNIEASNRNPSCALLMRMVVALNLVPPETHWLMTGIESESLTTIDLSRFEKPPPTSEDILRTRRLA